MWAIVVLAVVLICFGGVLLFGAPYLPTLKPQIKAALDLADLKAGDHLLELGCGDGRVLLAAAKRGLRVTGYELNPWLALLAWLRTRRYRRQVKVVWGNFWRAGWPEAQAIFTFLLPKYMSKLDKKVIQYGRKPVKLVSFAFEIPGRRPAKVKDGVFLYLYKPGGSKVTLT
jgi:SAM-dependent methyltransferase